MFIIILGGANDASGNLASCTLERINIFYTIFESFKKDNLKMILSGGYRFSTVSHCELVKKYLMKELAIQIEKEFVENNNTVDEAINMAHYFKDINYRGQIIIITSSWHLPRAQYLFNATFADMTDIELIWKATDERNIELEVIEKRKLEQIMNHPFGKWKKFLTLFKMDSMMEVKKEAIKRFGNNELSKYLIKLVQESFTNILRIKKGETYIPIKDIWSLWIKNKYIHKEFISEMIGLLMGYHNFDNKKSALMDNIVKNIDITDINRQLKTEGYYILNNTFDNVKCLHIKERLRGLYFHPFDSSKKIIGQQFLDKQLMVDGQSTFWICDQKQILSIPEVSDLTKDPALLKIVQTYLGCKPILCQTNVWYSCAGHRAERTQQFHQDYDGIHFLKVFIYLSDVTANTGPHRYIAGSIHNIIAPSGYQPSTRLSNEFVKKVYGDKIKTFTGKMGTMIIENTNGFHAGTPVQKGNRLILQLLYSATALPLQQKCQFTNL